MSDTGPRITPGLAGIPADVDVVVVGLGITGAGVALDAVTRGLSVLAVDAHDLAFGTSRWSSKLVHGGLRYLAQGQLAIAQESAVERGILMQVTAPHLVHALPMLTPLNDAMPRTRTALTWGGLRAGDVLRRTARTSTRTLPRPRRLNATETLSLAPSMRAETLRGGLLAWDGQLEDDARLVVTVARTAASYGAEVRTRARVTAATGTGVELRDELTGETYAVRARAVVNATGVWAGDLDDQVRLRPSRGTHLVLRGSALPHTRVAVMVPIPGSSSRFAMVLPQPDGTLYVGLTDEPVTGPVPDVPVPSEEEIDFLLGVVASAFTVPPTRADVVGAFAGLRPLLEVEGTDETADLSRRHAILTSSTGVTTVVGGKLTTYRRMAEDTVDALGLTTAPCRTASLPLLGAEGSSTAPARLVRRFGSDADLVLATARQVTGLPDDELLAPASEHVPVTLAELVFAVTHEGAHDVADLLDRRTRVGLDRGGPRRRRTPRRARAHARPDREPRDRQNPPVVRSINGHGPGLMGSFSTARPLPTPCGKGRPVHFMGSLRFAVSARSSPARSSSRLRPPPLRSSGLGAPPALPGARGPHIKLAPPVVTLLLHSRGAPRTFCMGLAPLRRVRALFTFSPPPSRLVIRLRHRFRAPSGQWPVVPSAARPGVQEEGCVGRSEAGDGAATTTNERAWAPRTQRAERAIKQPSAPRPPIQP